jgi:hypothetical protein
VPAVLAVVEVPGAQAGDDMQYECLKCAHACEVSADDYCPTCGEELPLFIEYRKDGWPLCPRCGEDELWSPLTFYAQWDGADKRLPVEKYIEAGMTCYRCNWKYKP